MDHGTNTLITFNSIVVRMNQWNCWREISNNFAHCRQQFKKRGQIICGLCLFDVWQLASHLATKLPCDTHNNNNNPPNTFLANVNARTWSSSTFRFRFRFTIHHSQFEYNLQAAGGDIRDEKFAVNCFATGRNCQAKVETDAETQPEHEEGNEGNEGRRTAFAFPHKHKHRHRRWETSVGCRKLYLTARPTLQARGKVWIWVSFLVSLYALCSMLYALWAVGMAMSLFHCKLRFLPSRLDRSYGNYS